MGCRIKIIRTVPDTSRIKNIKNVKNKKPKSGIEEVQILKGINLEVAREVHVMGNLMVQEKYTVSIMRVKKIMS